MISWIKSLFSDDEKVPDISEEQQARIASVALMYEVMRVDGDKKTAEQDALQKKLALRWQLEGAEAQSLIQRARKQAEEAVDYFQLVHVLREKYNADERRQLITDMWTIAQADGRIDPEEEHIIRKIADLMYVSHSDFIRGKLQQ
ncbi:MAG: TerB family tellurite resistance protein [Alcanivoracaceae bacterium]|nr:TerB family tellurite resistance protein [Alcanivoracaceae bacterium]